MFSDSDTIAAIATGFNNSGIGIIRISGDHSFSIISEIFKNKNINSPEDIESHRVYYGYIYDDGVLLDEVLMIPMKGPKSFTKEDTVEIDCHGGNLVLKKLLSLVLKKGARIAEPGEFTKRAFLNGRIDLSEAEAVMDLINSKNEIALSNSLKQLSGELYNKIRNIREKILYEIARIESALDDPEHFTLEAYPLHLKALVEELKEEIEKLLRSCDNGRIIKEGIRTVILGRPNVGKSSLLNFLSGYEKAIVTDIPGTTRDVIEENILFDGLNLIVFDTAGIRKSDDYVEQIGVKKAMEHASEADVLMLMLDSSNELTDEDIELFKFIVDKKAIVLLNKSDLSAKLTVEDIKRHTDSPVILISIKNQTGLDELSNILKDMFISGNIDFNDEIIITNERHKELLIETIKSLSNVLTSIENDMPEDFYSIDLTDSYDSLGRIIGEKVEDDIVNKIFSDFCVGK